MNLMLSSGSKILWITIFLFLAVIAWPSLAAAHCDGLDGPVVSAARKALESRDINPVLIWVQKNEEPEIRQAFEKTLTVRTQGDAARELADQYFFETLVRLHRAGEGAPYTGLKPAGRDLGPAIPAADKAVADGAVEPLMALLTATMREHLTGRFQTLNSAKGFAVDDIDAGRRYVKEYVEFVHYVERLYETAGHQSSETEGEATSAGTAEEHE